MIKNIYILAETLKHVYRKKNHLRIPVRLSYMYEQWTLHCLVSGVLCCILLILRAM